MRAIFISYRREDTEGQAGRLLANLVAHFGEDCVFMDVEGIDQHVANCGILLALIGRQWLEARDATGRRRLDDPLDFVRLATASALKRDIPVVPVLVQNASMPRAEQLPSDLTDLAYRNAVELTHARWDSDVRVLIKALTKQLSAHVAPSKQVASASIEPSMPLASAKRLPLFAIAAASLIAIALLVVAASDREQRLEDASFDRTSDASASATASDDDSDAAPSAETTTDDFVTDCAAGYEPRRAFRGDSVCVSHSSAARAAEDNRNAASRWQPGAYGDKTCVSGYVWRIAAPDDLVCVTPEVREETARENQLADLRTAAADTARAAH